MYHRLYSSIYLLGIYSVFKQHGVQYILYADDIQFWIHSTVENFSATIERAQQCVYHVKDWLRKNFLNLNEDKTEVIVLGNRQLTSRIEVKTVKLGDTVIQFSSKVRDLGLIVDSPLTFHDHISHVSSSSFAALKTIARVRRSLSFENCLLLVNALILSRILFCLSALNGITDSEMRRLQRLMNAASCLTHSCCSIGSDVTSQDSLLLMPAKSLLTFRSAVLAHSVVENGQPSYLFKLLCYKRSSRWHLRSHEQCTLEVPSRRTNIGRRAFSAFAPRLLNSLPLGLRNAPSIRVFKRDLMELLLESLSS